MAEEVEEKETEGQTQTQSDPKEVERAKMTGWTPKEQFRGDPEKWVPAEEWNRRTDEIMPILKSTNQKLESELTSTKTELQNLKKVVKQMADVNNKVGEREYQRALETIRKEQKAAVENGDGDKWEELEKQKDTLEKPQGVNIPDADTTQSTDAQKKQQEWMDKNDWCTPENPELYGYAQYIGNTLVARDGEPKLEHLDEIEKQVKEKFPDKFSNKRRETPSVDTGDTPPEKAGSKKNYNALPKEAKEQCDKLVDEIPGYTREQYVKDYFEAETE